MPDKRKHRGPHPDDRTLFAPDQWARLRGAVRDYSTLLTWGYAPAGALKLVGDHFRLVRRQRLAVMRAACGEPQRQGRQARRIEPRELAGREVVIDGYNLLITVEAHLAGGVVLRGRDGCLRDLAGMHGSYRRVEETAPALRRIGEVLVDLRPASVHWLLDRPVSNSGRLKGIIEALAAEHGWPWRVALSECTDHDLAICEGPIVTSDSAVLDRCGPWCNLAACIVERCPRSEPIIDLSDEATATPAVRPDTAS